MELEDPADGADLMMECEEEEQEVWPQSPDSAQEGKCEGAQETVRIIPIPAIPVIADSNSSSPTVNNLVKIPAAPLGFMVNGQKVPLTPGGERAELKLCSQPGGSASGFTRVQIPVTLTVQSPAGTRHISTTASLSTPASLNTNSDPPAGPEATPIITGVVSGEAAQKVLNDHSVNFKLAAKQSFSQKNKSGTDSSSSSSQPSAPHKLLRKGELGPVSPPDCSLCMSHYKLIPELRGFLCLCSPVIAQSLKYLKKNNRWSRRSKGKSKTSRSSSRGSKTRPAPFAPKVICSPVRTRRLSDELLSDQLSSPTTPNNINTINSPQRDLSETLPDLPHGKLVILVEDFYYGLAPGSNVTKSNTLGEKFTGPYRCIHCPKKSRNNIKLMSHMQQHMSMKSQHNQDVDALPSCPHCFRRFMSPFKLQRHMKAVHSQCKSTATCKICELDFGSEPLFLQHMKSSHKPGEMPYACQVCGFRSSFYTDVWSHFQETHADTKYLMCQYCLRVLRSNTCYQQHFARHQRKNVFGCDKCRLHFLYAKERVEHNALNHRTHIRPPQLTGLKPGTKVTVRTYSVVGGSENEEGLKKPAAPCKVVDVDPPPSTHEVLRRKPVESLAPLLSKLSQDSIHQTSHRCVECLSWVHSFRAHFPSLVHCSLCRFVTCCSTSYANHMINNHASCIKIPQYQAIYQSDPRLVLRLECVSCTYFTNRGDMMANHLTERPEHNAVRLTQPELQGVKPGLAFDGATSPGRRSGAFVPIHLLPSVQTSTQLSVKPLTPSCALYSRPAMTIRVLGPHTLPHQPPVSPLSVSQLSAVLSSLCHGVSQASRLHHASPEEIRSWTEQQENCLGGKKWFWRTEKMAEWVLIQREQQLMVNEDVLLQTTRMALGEGSSVLDCYSWTVDFMLRHGLSLQPPSPKPLNATIHHQRNTLPKSLRDNCCSFIKSFCLQIQNKRLAPHFMGCMDELTIFIDQDGFRSQNPGAFQLYASSRDEPVLDVILSALSDGTFLTPLMFFAGGLSHVPDGFPENVLLEARQEGFKDQERLQIWIDKVWRPRMAASTSLLVADPYRGHQLDEFRDGLSSMSSDVLFIPSGCSCRLQPLDVCVMPVLRDFLQARWTQLVSQGGLDGLGLDQLAVTLACWLSEVSFTLNSRPSVLRRSFSSVCKLQHLDNRQDAAEMFQALTKALVQPVEVPEQLVMGKRVKVEETQEQQELLLNTSTTLCHMFEGDSDQETFHGFQDEDMDE